MIAAYKNKLGIIFISFKGYSMVNTYESSERDLKGEGYIRKGEEEKRKLKKSREKKKYKINFQSTTITFQSREPFSK